MPEGGDFSLENKDDDFYKEYKKDLEDLYEERKGMLSEYKPNSPELSQQYNDLLESLEELYKKSNEKLTNTCDALDVDIEVEGLSAELNIQSIIDREKKFMDVGGEYLLQDIRDTDQKLMKMFRLQIEFGEYIDGLIEKNPELKSTLLEIVGKVNQSFYDQDDISVELVNKYRGQRDDLLKKYLEPNIKAEVSSLKKKGQQKILEEYIGNFSKKVKEIFTELSEESLELVNKAAFLKRDTGELESGN